MLNITNCQRNVNNYNEVSLHTSQSGFKKSTNNKMWRGCGEKNTLTQFSSVQSLSRVRLFETPWSATWQASLSNINSRSLLKLMSIVSVLPSNHLTLCHPLILLLSIFPSIRVFSNESVLCIRWPKYCSFSFSISLSSEYSGLISFRMDWLDGFKSPRDSQESSPTPNSSKASILQQSTLFIVQLSHPYVTTGKTIALARPTFVGKILLLSYKLVQQLWRRLRRFLTKLKIELPYDTGILLLGIHPDKTIIQKDTCTPMFIAALFTIAHTWKQPKCSSIDE